MRSILVILFAVFIYTPSFGYDVSPSLVPQQVSVLVKDRSPEVLDQALQAAFVQEVTRLSGDPKVMSTPRMQGAARAVKLWVESYRYVELPSTNPNLPATLMLQVTFNSIAIQKILAENNGDMKPPVIQKNASQSQKAAISIVVKNIQSEKDLQTVAQALKGVYGVDRVSVKGLQGDEATLIVSYAGDTSHFENMITQDHRFKVSSMPLEYEWAGYGPS